MIVYDLGILKPGFNSIDDGTLKSTKTPEQSSLPSPKQKKPKKQKKEESDFEDENDDDEDLEGGLGKSLYPDLR